MGDDDSVSCVQLIKFYFGSFLHWFILLLFVYLPMLLHWIFPALTLSLRRWCLLRPLSSVLHLIPLLIQRPSPSPSLSLVLACRWRTVRSVTSVVRGSMCWSASVLRASSSTGAASLAISAASHSDWEDTPLTRLQVSAYCPCACFVKEIFTNPHSKQ